MKITKTSPKQPKKTESSQYSESVNYIKSAIDSLGKVAKDDVLARESIANLSVVLFDLKS